MHERQISFRVLFCASCMVSSTGNHMHGHKTLHQTEDLANKLVLGVDVGE